MIEALERVVDDLAVVNSKLLLRCCHVNRRVGWQGRK